MRNGHFLNFKATTLAIDNCTLSQGAIAKRLGVSERTMSRWLHGEGGPTDIQLFELAMTLNESQRVPGMRITPLMLIQGIQRNPVALITSFIDEVRCEKSDALKSICHLQTSNVRWSSVGDSSVPFCKTFQGTNAAEEFWAAVFAITNIEGLQFIDCNKDGERYDMTIIERLKQVSSGAEESFKLRSIMEIDIRGQLRSIEMHWDNPKSLARFLLT